MPLWAAEGGGFFWGGGALTPTVKPPQCYPIAQPEGPWRSNHAAGEPPEQLYPLLSLTTL